MQKKMTLYDKRNNYRETIIYAIQNDNHGFVQFLIYENNSWKWISGKHFSPYENDWEEDWEWGD